MPEPLNLDVPHIEEKEEKTATDSSSEENKTEKTQSDEGEGSTRTEKPLPFGEDPRIQEYISRQVDARGEKMREQIVREVKEELAKANQKPADDKDGAESIPEWFGGDLKQWKAYKADQARILADTRKGWEDEQKNARSAEEKAVVEANKHFDESVLKIETASGQKVDRKKLLEYVVKNEIVDMKNRRWDYEKGYRWMVAEEKAQTGAAPANQGGKDRQARKDLAAATTTDAGKGEKETSTVKTSEDFKNPSARPW